MSQIALPLTPTLPFRRGICIYTSWEMADFGAFLPLLLTQEGGEIASEPAKATTVTLRLPLATAR